MNVKNDDKLLTQSIADSRYPPNANMKEKNDDKLLTQGSVDARYPATVNMKEKIDNKLFTQVIADSRYPPANSETMLNKKMSKNSKDGVSFHTKNFKYNIKKKKPKKYSSSRNFDNNRATA